MNAKQLLLTLAACLVALLGHYTRDAHAADEQSSLGRLQMANGNRIPGQFVEMTESHLVWQLPPFAEPLVIRRDVLRSVDFAARGAVLVPEGRLRLVTRANDVFFGDLVAATNEHVTLRSARIGDVTLPWSSLRGIYRLDSTSTAVVSLHSWKEWRSLRPDRSPDDWTLAAGGAITTKIVGAEMFHALNVKGGCEIELSLSWSRKPGLLLTVATAEQIRSGREPVKLETWDEDLVIQSLNANGNFVQISDLADNDRLDIRVHWDPQTSAMEVFTFDGTLIGTLAIGKPGVEENVGLFLQNKGADLTVHSINVRSWNAWPQDATAAGQWRVLLQNGEARSGTPMGVDANHMTLRPESGEPVTIAWDSVASVGIASDLRDETPQTMVHFADGCVLHGDLRAIDDKYVHFKISSSSEPIVAKRDALTHVVFLAPDAAEAEFEAADVLMWDEVKLHGHLAAAGPDKQLGWQVTGSQQAVAIPPQLSGRVKRQSPPNSAEQQDDGGADTLYLRAGDVVACRVIGLDEDHVEIAMAGADPVRIPAESVQAVELAVDPNHTHDFAFNGPAWQVDEDGSDNVVRSEGEAKFSGPAVLAHRTAMANNAVSFDMRWYQTQTVMMINLFADDPQQTMPADVIIYLTGTHLVIRNNANGGGTFHQVEAKNNSVRLSLSVVDHHVGIEIDGRAVFRQELSDRNTSNRGIVMSVSPIGAAAGPRWTGSRAPLLSLTNFQQQTVGSAISTLLLSERQKEYLLTVPRGRAQNPPTHVLVATNGDLLRGRLNSLDQEAAALTSRLSDVTIPRERLAAVIWLRPSDALPAEIPEDGQRANVRATLSGGANFHFTAHNWIDQRIVGQHPVLGKCSIPWSRIAELQFGDLSVQNTSPIITQWSLQQAKQPQFVAGEAAAGAPGLNSPLVGTVAPDFQAELIDGSSFQLSEHADKVIVLDFWASWCGPCVRGMPDVIKAVEAAGADKIVLLAVNQGEASDTIRGFLDRQQWQVQAALDRNSAVGRLYGVNAIPQTVVIRPGGRIERLYVGSGPGVAEDLQSVLEVLVTSVPDK